MPVAQVRCPACTAALRSTQTIPAGAKLKCPKCAKPFVYQGANGAAHPPGQPGGVEQIEVLEEVDALEAVEVLDCVEILEEDETVEAVEALDTVETVEEVEAVEAVEAVRAAPKPAPRPAPKPAAVVAKPKPPPKPAPQPAVAKTPTRPSRGSAVSAVLDEDEDEEDPKPRKGKGRKQDDDEEDEAEEKRGGGLWIAVGIGGGVLALGAVAVVVVLFATSRPKATDSVAQGPPPTVPAPGPNPPVPPPSSNPNPNPGGGRDGELALEVLDRVKKATVYIRVQTPRGMATGTGFFEETCGMVLTNAHVVGMLKPDAPKPTRVEVVLNSGLRDETKLNAQVLCVDRSSDLAVLKLDAGAGPLPPPLPVKPAGGLRETQKVFVIGYPFGESLGKNVTVSTSSVSSLRTNPDGVLDKVQVNGGMNPGNSGGPVIDAQGNVVGVAVSGIEGTNLNFAIPGEYVHIILGGRLSEVGVGEGVRRGAGIAVDVTLVTIDPLGKMRDLKVDYWVAPDGNPGRASDTEPPLPPGVIKKQVNVAYQPATNTGKAEVVLDAVPPSNSVLWIRPVVTNPSGKPRWMPAVTRPVEDPPEAKAMTLAFKPKLISPNQKDPTPVRLVSVQSAKFALGDQEQKLVEQLTAQLKEGVQVIPPAQGGGFVAAWVPTQFTVRRWKNDKEQTLDAKEQRIMQDGTRIRVRMICESNGKPKDRIAEVLSQPPLPPLPESTQNELKEFGYDMARGVELSQLPLPGGEVQPNHTWQAQRTVPLYESDDGKSVVTAPADLTYTFKGARNVGGKELAVVYVSGPVHFEARGGGDRVRGSARGILLLDPATGQATRGSLTFEMVREGSYQGRDARIELRHDMRLIRGPEALAP